VAAASIVSLTACEEANKYQPPPAAQVTVASPEQRKVRLYMEVTGSTAPVNKVELVARVQGFLDKVAYKDGAAVKKGDLLFQIDKKDYEINLQIAEASQVQQEAPF
jgi:multidrug efflux pump subunit AcrA (membrane-fusion protein)